MKLTRRTFVAAGSAGVVATAGCLGGEDEVEEPDEPPLPIPVVGDPDASVTVRVFEDFSCPGCREFKLGVYPEIEAAYIDSGDIRYEHHDFPIPVDETWSWGIAGAARSVQEQGGDEAFWSFASEIYEHQGSYSYEAIETVAENVGVDGEQASSDAEEGVYRDQLEELRANAEEAGVSGTPTVVVNDSVVDPEFSAIEAAIDAALE